MSSKVSAILLIVSVLVPLGITAYVLRLPYVYGKTFEGENSGGLRGLSLNRESFPMKYVYVWPCQLAM